MTESRCETETLRFEWETQDGLQRAPARATSRSIWGAAQETAVTHHLNTDMDTDTHNTHLDS